MSWEASQAWGMCLMASKYCLYGEVGMEMVWFGLGDMEASSGEQGEKREGGVIGSKKEPERPAHIPAPTGVLHISEFSSLKELAGLILWRFQRDVSPLLCSHPHFTTA